MHHPYCCAIEILKLNEFYSVSFLTKVIALTRDQKVLDFDDGEGLRGRLLFASFGY